MKNKISILLLFLLSGTGLHAINSDLITSVALVGMSMDYREYDVGGNILDSEKSDFTDIAGVEMSLGYFFEKEVSAYSQVHINLMLLSGKTKYIGSYISSENSVYGEVSSTTVNTIVDTDISYKRTNILSKNIELSYGIGLGYRSWKRAFSVSQVEIYKWYSLRPAVGIKFDMNTNVNIGIGLEYQYAIDPKMSESTYDYDFKLGRADIIELSFALSHRYSELIDIFVGATLQQQTIEKSNSIYRTVGNELWKIWEPDSTANNQYLKLGLAFKF